MRRIKECHILTGQKHTNLDVVVVREKHGESVNSHSPSSSGRQAVFQRVAERLVDRLSLVVSGQFVLNLVFQKTNSHV